MAHSGLFIVFEGIDGTGKSTQARRLAEWFRNEGRDVVLSREPTDGPWGARLRESAITGRLPSATELEYFIEDRKQHVADLISPALASGKVVILDRYYFSTMAYQSLRGYDPTEIRRINESFAPVPNILIILDLDVESAMSRIHVRGDAANEFERRDSLAACRGIFRSMESEHFAHIISAAGSEDQIAARILKLVFPA